MNLSELNSKLRLAKFHPITVAGNPFATDREALIFQGDLEEYFEALRSLGIGAVFINTGILEERHFWYEPRDRVPVIEEGMSEEQEEFDLCEIEPALTEYKQKYLGQIGGGMVQRDAGHAEQQHRQQTNSRADPVPLMQPFQPDRTSLAATF